MRQAAQRHMELQGCMPADISTMGYHLTVGSQAAINRAFAAWQERRGIAGWTDWKNRRRKPIAQAAPEPPKEKPVEAPRPPKPPKAPGTPAIKVPRELKTKLSPAEARERELARKRAYRLANKEKANELNREYQRRRRAAMTPEQRKAESIEVTEYKKKAKETK